MSAAIQNHLLLLGILNFKMKSQESFAGNKHKVSGHMLNISLIQMLVVIYYSGDLGDLRILLVGSGAWRLWFPRIFLNTPTAQQTSFRVLLPPGHCGA